MTATGPRPVRRPVSLGRCPRARRRLQRRALDPAFELAARTGRRGDGPVRDPRRRGRDRRHPARVVRATRQWPRSGPTPSASSPRSPSRSSRRPCCSRSRPAASTLDEPLDGVAPGPRSTRAGSPFTAWHVLSHTTGIDDVDLEALLIAGRRAARSCSAGRSPLRAGARPGRPLPLRVGPLRPPRRGRSAGGSGGRSSDAPRRTCWTRSAWRDTTFDPRPDRAGPAGAGRPSAGGGSPASADRGAGRRVHRAAPGGRRPVEHGRATSSGSGGRCSAAASSTACASCRRRSSR